MPLFISEGYFTEEVIPRELGFCAKGQREFPRVQQRGGQTLYYCGPVGTHDSMTDVIVARAREVVAQHPFPRAPLPADIALFIAGHGTGNNENSRKAIERQVELIRARGVFGEVHPAFMEEEPRIGGCYAVAQARNIVMVPFLSATGCIRSRTSRCCSASRSAWCRSACAAASRRGATRPKSTANASGIPRASGASRICRR